MAWRTPKRSRACRAPSHEPRGKAMESAWPGNFKVRIQQPSESIYLGGVSRNPQHLSSLRFGFLCSASLPSGTGLHPPRQDWAPRETRTWSRDRPLTVGETGEKLAGRLRLRVLQVLKKRKEQGSVVTGQSNVPPWKGPSRHGRKSERTLGSSLRLIRTCMRCIDIQNHTNTFNPI